MPIKAIDRIGQKVGRLTVIALVGNKNNGSCFLFRCDCGVEVVKGGGNVFHGNTWSCGCLKKEVSKTANKGTHRMSNTKPWKAWRGMRERCYQATNKDFHKYGGRGITVCERWQKFENFYADMGDPLPSQSLDRIDVNGNYCPENCRWASALMQTRNRRTTVLLEFKGKRQTIGEWSDETGITFSAIKNRIYAGWSVEKTLTVPSRIWNKAHQKQPIAA